MVGLDLMLVLSTERLCSLNPSLRRRLVSPICIVNGSGYIVSCRLNMWYYRFCGKICDGFRLWRKMYTV